MVITRSLCKRAFAPEDIQAIYKAHQKAVKILNLKSQRNREKVAKIVFTIVSNNTKLNADEVVKAALTQMMDDIVDGLQIADRRFGSADLSTSGVGNRLPSASIPTDDVLPCALDV